MIFPSFIVISNVLIKLFPSHTHTSTNPGRKYSAQGDVYARRWWQLCNATTPLLMCIYFSIKLSGLCVRWFNGKLQVLSLLPPIHVTLSFVCLSGMVICESSGWLGADARHRWKFMYYAVTCLPFITLKHPWHGGDLYCQILVIIPRRLVSFRTPYLR